MCITYNNKDYKYKKFFNKQKLFKENDMFFKKNINTKLVTINIIT